MSTELLNLRHQIDHIDKRILDLLVLRFQVISVVARHKAHRAVPARIPARIKKVIDNREAQGCQLGMPQGTARAIWTVIVEEACRHEEALMTPAETIDRS